MSSFISPVPSDVSIPRQFIVNLDLPPRIRWKHITRVYVDQLKDAQNQIDKIIENFINPTLQAAIETIVSSILSATVKTGLVFYGEELRGLADDSGIDLGRLTLMQFVYECVACCTSILCQNKENNVPIHIRTMDWGLKCLKKLTIDVEFQKEGRSISKATTWIGYVGVLTGMRLNKGYSVAVNFRRTGGQWFENLKTAILRGWPVGFLVRHVLEETNDYSLAVEQLAQSVLIAPCYFSVCDSNTNTTQATLITRTQRTETNRLTLIDNKLLVQTNMDHWSDKEEEDILLSRTRRRVVKNELETLDNINEPDLWNVLSKYPIFNEITIYGTFMCPKYDIYHTRFPDDRLGFKSNVPTMWIPICELDLVKEPRASSQIYRCHKCSEDFDIDNNGPGNCVHTGQWHSRYQDCSYLKCGFQLAMTASIGRQHWSCCYSLESNSMKCQKSLPHTFIKP